jgi:Zn-finger nucleic acid-binding protein
MATYERNGIHVDQCTDCRGLFLDRGELEHLIAAEQNWNAPAAPAQPQAMPQMPQPGYATGYQPGYKHKKKRSFLEELFD